MPQLGNGGFHPPDNPGDGVSGTDAEPRGPRACAVQLMDNPLTDLWLYPIKLANRAADALF
jgi:hypothetical protein